MHFKFEGSAYKVTLRDVLLFPQGYSAIVNHPEFVRDEPSVLLMDVGGWTVDLIRIDNGRANAARYISGACVPVDGGALIGF